ncbi:MAG TPA: GNVR domain-containing protein [Burkholderiales bacterium]|nr:GNVR domain-containing protein [Burkholderiales bacterium]
MNLSQFLLALRARKKAFIAVMIAVVAAAVAMSLVLPKRYVGSTTVLVDLRDEQSLAAGPRGLTARERASYIATQVDLIRSGRVATQVVRDLKLAHAPGVREEFETATGGLGKIDDWLAASLLERLKVDVAASNVITITYTSSNPRRAAEVANGFAKAYIETTLALRTEPTREAALWFAEQLKGLRAEVTRAQARLTAYQREKGITSLDERTDLEGARFAELNTQLMAARNVTYEAQARFQQAQEVLAGGTPEALADVMGSAAILAVRADLARAESAFQVASADLGPNHPVYHRLRGEVEALRGKLNGEMRKVVAALGNAARAAQRREDELKNALAEQQKRVQAQKDYRIELATLTRDVESHQRTYEAALARMVSNQVDSRARQTDVAVLTPAVEPVQPAFPRPNLIAALAVVLGAMLAAAVVFLLETLDRRVRSRSDLELRLAVPTLGRLSRWQPTGGRLLPAPSRASRALPHPW